MGARGAQADVPILPRSREQQPLRGAASKRHGCPSWPGAPGKPLTFSVCFWFGKGGGGDSVRGLEGSTHEHSGGVPRTCWRGHARSPASCYSCYAVTAGSQNSPRMAGGGGWRCPPLAVARPSAWGEDGARGAGCLVPTGWVLCTYLHPVPPDPSAPLDLVLLPRPAALWASWRAGPGARDGYLLRLSGPAERNSTRGPGALRATFPGPLPPGHYTLELGALAGPYDAWARASAWLPGESGLPGMGGGTCPGTCVEKQPRAHSPQAASSADSAAQPAQSNGSELPLDGLAAPAEPGRQALLYTEGAPGLPGNISVPPATALGTSGGPAPGAHSRVDIASSLRNTTRNLTDHTSERQPPCPLTPGWDPAAGGGSPGEEGSGLTGPHSMPPLPNRPSFRAPGAAVTGGHRQGQPL